MCHLIPVAMYAAFSSSEIQFGIQRPENIANPRTKIFRDELRSTN